MRRTTEPAGDSIEQETAEEKSFAGSVEEDMRGLAEGVSRTGREATEEEEHSGEEAAASDQPEGGEAQGEGQSSRAAHRIGSA